MGIEGGLSFACAAWVVWYLFLSLFVPKVLSYRFQDLALYLRRRARRPFSIVNFDPVSAAARYSEKNVAWLDMAGNPASPPSYSALPTPSDVLSGRAAPAFDGLRLRDKATFVCGNLHRYAHIWDATMVDIPEYDLVRPWIHDKIHIPAFFQPFKGPFGASRFFDSESPPKMYFQNAPICADYVDFISDTILLRLQEGSMTYWGKVGVDSPPHVVNALSIEPIKPRLILSMRAVNLFCCDTPFSLAPLSDIVRHVSPGDFFSSYDDVQGYKQLSLTPASYTYCGFEWGGHWFADTTLPFGWKNSAYVYTTTGNVLTAWLKARSVYSALWIDDRFLGSAPPLRTFPESDGSAGGLGAHVLRDGVGP